MDRRRFVEIAGGAVVAVVAGRDLVALARRAPGAAAAAGPIPGATISLEASDDARTWRHVFSRHVPLVARRDGNSVRFEVDGSAEVGFPPIPHDARYTRLAMTFHGGSGFENLHMADWPGITLHNGEELTLRWPGLILEV
jgi:hypothetical protein